MRKIYRRMMLLMSLHEAVIMAAIIIIQDKIQAKITLCRSDSPKAQLPLRSAPYALQILTVQIDTTPASNTIKILNRAFSKMSKISPEERTAATEAGTSSSGNRFHRILKVY